MEEAVHHRSKEFGLKMAVEQLGVFFYPFVADKNVCFVESIVAQIKRDDISVGVMVQKSLVFNKHLLVRYELVKNLKLKANKNQNPPYPLFPYTRRDSVGR